MQIVQPTTASQIFHVLRRQMVRDLRKPLIIFTPVVAAQQGRHLAAVRVHQGRFQTVIPEQDATVVAEGQARDRCSGKVYYDLVKKRARRKPTTWRSSASSSSIPSRTRFSAELKKYPNATDVVWCQDEPQNQGAWFFVQHNIHENMLEGQKPGYAGRPASASPPWATRTCTRSSKGKIDRLAIRFRAKPRVLDADQACQRDPTKGKNDHSKNSTNGNRRSQSSPALRIRFAEATMLHLEEEAR